MGLCAKTLNTSYRWVNGHFGTEKRSRAWAAKAHVVSVKVDWALYLIQNQFIFLNKLFRLAKQLDDWDFKCEIWQIHHVTLPSDSFFSWLEYDQTNQHRFRRKRRELVTVTGSHCDLVNNAVQLFYRNWTMFPFENEEQKTSPRVSSPDRFWQTIS